MAISNRDLDTSEKKKAFSVTLGKKSNPNVTSSTLMLGTIPFRSELTALSVAGFGLSGAPQIELRIQRFIAGAGGTLMAPGISAIVPEMGVSGPVGVSLPASGNTLIQLLPGDQLVALTAVANTSTDSMTVGYVLKALQDFKADFGSAT